MISICCEYKIPFVLGGYLDSSHDSNLFNQFVKMICSETFSIGYITEQVGGNMRVLFECYDVFIHSLN